MRNYDSYGHKVTPMNEKQKAILCDPQTSEGLMIAVDPTQVEQVTSIFRKHQLNTESIGTFLPLQKEAYHIYIE